MRRLIPLLLLGALMGPTLAAAREVGYVGGSWGSARWDLGFEPGLSTDPSTQAWRAFVGADAEVAALELGWVKFGQVVRQDGSGQQASLLARGFSADVLLKLPLRLSPDLQLEPFVKAGRVLARTQVRGNLFYSGADEISDSHAKFGLGLQLKIGSQGLLRAEYERYTMGETLGIGSVNVFSVGAGIRF